MWKMIMLLWSVPLALGIVMLARLAEGSSPINNKEWQLFFGDTKDLTWSLWLGLEFIALAALFFMIGVFEGLVLVNFGSLWVVAAALMTGVAAMFLLAHCLRSASREKRIPARDSASSRARESLQAIRQRLKSHHLPF